MLFDAQTHTHTIHANYHDFSVKVPLYYCLPRLHASHLLIHEFSNRLARGCPGASGLRSQIVVPRGISRGCVA